jgi:hypothetical protein
LTFCNNRDINISYKKLVIVKWRKKSMKKRLTSMLLALGMCACLAGCGSKDDGSDKSDNNNTTNAAVTEEPATEAGTGAASTQVSGGWSVDVPADWTFSIGDVFDENDTRYFSVKKSSLSGFSFSADSE